MVTHMNSLELLQKRIWAASICIGRICIGRICIGMICIGLSGPEPAFAQTPQAAINYGRDVRPILSENCFQCHGQDDSKRMAGLRLDSYEGATADRKGSAALVPGKPEASLLYQRITAESKARRMPPVFANKTLTPEQIAILKRWIEEGGKYTKHWAFVPPVRTAVPQAQDPWARRPIDGFILQRLRSEGLRPSPEATPETWLRRVSLDLAGLPPSPAELDVFSKQVRARGEAAYEAAADRLLASSAYGERMAMDWLDVARYADTHGFNNDAERSMWRWRDWVIQSFNANMPYDRFITEQLAGDLLPSPTLDQRIATGFNRNNVINSEGGIIEEEYRSQYVTDRVRTLGMAWMGLTLECAHCHNHKFDPITQRDHYRFYAFFNNVPELGEDGRVANAVPMIPAPTSEQQKQMRELEAAIVKLSQRMEQRESAWKGRDSRVVAHLASPTDIPGKQMLAFPCPAIAVDKGPAEHACAPASVEPKPQTTVKVAVSKHGPLTFSLWLKPAASDSDVALFSSIDYSQNSAAATFGEGFELRLNGGELEFRFSQRFPNYSLRVKSEGAALKPGDWRHLTLVYAGADKDSLRVDTSSVRIFADGREVGTHVLNDDLPLPSASEDKPKPTTFRVGWEKSATGARYAGLMDDVSVWSRALNSAEIDNLFESRALPYALSVARDRRTPVETGWLRQAALRASNAGFAKDWANLQKLQGDLFALRRETPTVMVMQEMATPRETHILVRGSYDAPGEKVDAGVPENLLGAWPAGAPRNRLGLAQWLTKPDHPLTSRVVVNRFWQQLFGFGLVKTSDNFGLQGESPSHPELLDWLAIEFVESGWNVKALMKMMVLSATYRQVSDASPELVARDPENRLLARGPRFRLPAEIIRDQALQISGLLKQSVGGPSVFPYQPAGLYKGIVVAANYPGTAYIESTGDGLYRRSLYTYWKRTVPHPTMIVFDAPDREVCIVRRTTTNTPLQALTLLNDPIFVEAARKLAERVVKEGGASAETRLALGFRLATGRAPNQHEMQLLRESLDTMLAAYRKDEAGARSLLGVGASKPDSSISAVELAAWTAVANVILNMDETITKG
jgi:mono/diheme cytochrome c family protein